MTSGNKDSGRNGWEMWSKHVLAELERLNYCIESLRTEIHEVHIELANLQGKAMAWGAAGGMILSIIIGLIMKVVFKA